MFTHLRKRAQTVGLPPGTPMYTGERKKDVAVRLTVFTYSADGFQEQVFKNPRIEDLPEYPPSAGVVWINIEGIQDTKLVTAVAERYQLHPLTVEDILTVEQRSKVEMFDHYYYLTFRTLSWQPGARLFSIEPVSLVFGKHFVLSFHEHESDIFKPIYERLRSTAQQRLRQQGSDYLVYRLVDIVVDQYFVVLEALGDHVQNIEEDIIGSGRDQNSNELYRLKREVMSLRKTIWPMREVVNQLLHTEDERISSFTRVYLRDVHDHAVQAVETLEIFRDMLSGLLDVYLSTLSHRMNEIMKVLTMISTIFIPITFITGFFGMNFKYIPGLQSNLGYMISIILMLIISGGMLVFFRRKHWI